MICEEEAGGEEEERTDEAFAQKGGAWGVAIEKDERL